MERVFTQKIGSLSSCFPPTHHHSDHHIIFFCQNFSYSTHSLSKYLLRAYHIPGTVLGYKQKKFLISRNLHFYSNIIIADIYSAFNVPGTVLDALHILTQLILKATMSKVLLLPPYCRWENWGTKSLSHSCNASQVVSGEAAI